jgi:hypothetical protein
MIISHSKRYIFVKTAKTAGSSVEALLGETLAPEDEWITKGKGEVKPGRVYYHAKTSEIIRARRGEWLSYFTFAIVRHPLDRLVSAYWYRKKKDGENFSSFSEFLREAPKGYLIHEHLQPLPDKIIFFEKLKKGLGELNLELDTRRLPHLKGDTREGPRKLWTGEDKEFFRRKMKKEYEFHKNLGYRL